MSKRSMTEWDTIMRNIPSPDDSDAEDCVNVLSLQKNAPKVVQLLQHLIPGVSQTTDPVIPRGMNRVDAIRDGLSSTLDVVQKLEEMKLKAAHGESGERVRTKDDDAVPNDAVVRSTNSTQAVSSLLSSQEATESKVV